MAFFGKLFGNAPAKDRSGLLEQVLSAQKGQDLTKLARACYRLGVYEMDHGDLARGQLWLNRCQWIYDAQEDVCERLEESIQEDCGDRLSSLEDAPILANQVLAQALEKAEALDEDGVRLWGLMTLARLGKVGKRLAAVPGCEALGELDWAAELTCQWFCGPYAGRESDVNHLRDLCGRLYDLADSAQFANSRQEAEVPGGPPLQTMDLCGLICMTELHLYLDGQCTLLEGGGAPPEAELVPCALLADYYLRTREGDIAALPQIQAEQERIWADYDFLMAKPEPAAVRERIAAYLDLDILA